MLKSAWEEHLKVSAQECSREAFRSTVHRLLIVTI